MRKCNTTMAVYEQIRRGGKTFKPELYVAIANSNEYLKHRQTQQKISDAKLAEFLRNVCGANERGIKEITNG